MKWITRQIVNYSFLLIFTMVALCFVPYIVTSWMWDSFCKVVDWAYEGKEAPWDGI